MTSLADIKEKLVKHKSDFFDKYAINELAIFGSYSRGQNNSESDVDILVEFKKPIGVEFIDLAEELENILKMKVDLVSKHVIKMNYLKNIESELVYV